MGNVSRTLQPRQDWTRSEAVDLNSNPENSGAAASERSELTEQIDDSDPLNAAKGAVLGVALGSMIWALL